MTKAIIDPSGDMPGSPNDVIGSDGSSDLRRAGR
jgi:hypothetical protein